MQKEYTVYGYVYKDRYGNKEIHCSRDHDHHWGGRQLEMEGGNTDSGYTWGFFFLLYYLKSMNHQLYLNKAGGRGRDESKRA